MKFMLTFDWSPNTETRAEAVERFRKKRVHCPRKGSSFLEDAKKLFEFAYMWGTLMELETSPVLDHQELKAALESATKWIPPFKHSA